MDVLILPMVILVLLTLFVGFGLSISRFMAISKGTIKPSYFKIMTGQNAPESIIKFSRNFSNLFEVPTLFYVVCAIAISLNVESDWLPRLAWAFVMTRILHTLIHLTYNHPGHRASVFLISTLIVVAMWLNLLWIVKY